MNTKNTLSLKTLFPIIIVLSIVIFAIYSIALHEVEVAKVTVELTNSEPFTVSRFNDSEKDELIGDISIHKTITSKLGAPKGNEMQMPGISVALYDEKGYILTEWVSAAIKDKGVYELELGLNRHVENGEIIRVAVYVNDEKGNVVIGKRQVVTWR